MVNTQQIGKAGELLVQYKLLLKGVESAPMTTDSGIDLVVYTPQKHEAITIQIKSNFKPKPAGGKGKLILDWWIPDGSPAQLIAVADLSMNRVWLFTLNELNQLAQQHHNGKYHLCMNVDPTMRPKNPSRPAFVHEFESYLLENRFHVFF